MAEKKENTDKKSKWTRALEKSKWTRALDTTLFSEELLLPSFDIHLTRSAPYAVAIPAGRAIMDETLDFDSGDAFSISYLHPENVSTADQDFLRLDPGHLRRILLRILGEEEYHKVVAHQYTLKHFEPKPGLPEGHTPDIIDLEIVRDPNPRAQVRISDLRLAKDITPQRLKREVKPVLSSLSLPITTDSVTRWKYETLKENKTLMKKSSERTKKEHEDERVWVVAVSFAAAALLLLRDLDMRRLEKAGHDDLTNYIVTLARIIETLIEDFDKSTYKLLNLLASSGEDGRPPDPDIKRYTALFLHRMRRSREGIARRLRSTSPPRDDNKQQLPKNWMQTSTSS